MHRGGGFEEWTSSWDGQRSKYQGSATYELTHDDAREEHPDGGYAPAHHSLPKALAKSFSMPDFSGSMAIAGAGTPIALPRAGRRPEAMPGLMW